MTRRETKPPAVREGQLLTVIPTPQIKLATIDDCRLEMAKIYRDTKAGNRETADASRLVYMLTSIAKMIELGQLEQRITALEGKRNGNN